MNTGAAPDALLAAVDAAYPFGERARLPYKAWLAERQLLVDEIEPPPSPDEWAAIEVARDLVELGRVEEARALLEEQAPGRHARRCPTCGAARGESCRDLRSVLSTFGPGSVPYNATSYREIVPCLIPHAARVQP